MNVNTNTKINWLTGRKQRFLWILLCLFPLLLGSSVAVAQQDTKQHVLILNSYHQGFSWTDRIVASIDEVLAEADVDAEIHVEYMDTKRLLNEEYLTQLYELYQRKYAAVPIDVIIVSDNNGLEFLRTYGEDLFPGTPIVFTGINNFSDELLIGFDQITGVVEELDIAATLELMLAFHPNTEQVYLLNDQTPSGIATLESFEQVRPQFEDQVEFVILDDFAVSDMQNELAELPPNSLILMLLVNRDNTGQFFTYEESLAALSQYTEVPIYGVWDFYIGYGIVGGKLTDGNSQGRAAGEMSLRILQGESATDIPILRESPNRYIFDYQQLQKYNINTGQLPEDSLLLNEPVSFYDQYKVYIWMVVAVFFILVAAIIILLMNISRRQQAEIELQQSYLRRGRQVKLSTQVAQDITGISELEELYHNIVHQIKEQFGYYHTQILQYDSEINAIRLIAGYGEIGERMLAEGHRVSMGVGLIGRAAASGESVLRGTLANDLDWKPNPLLPDTQGEIAVPIKLGSEILGVLDVQSDQPGALNTDDQLLLEGLCGQIAIAIENARTTLERQKLLLEVEAQATRLVQLNELSAALNQANSLDEMYVAVAKSLPNIVGSARISLAMVDHSGEAYETRNLSIEEGSVSLGNHLPLAGTAVGVSIQEQRIKHFPQDGAMASFADLRELVPEGIKSVMAVPLIIGGEAIGALNIASSVPDFFDTEEMSLLQQATTLIASSLQVRKFLEEAEQQAQELQTVAEVSTAIATTLDQQKLLKDVVNLAKERFALYHAHIYLLDDTNQNLVLSAGAGEIGDQMVGEGRSISIGAEQSLVARAAQSRQGVIVNDVQADPGFLAHPLLPNTSSEMAVPMVVGDQLLGVLDVQANEVNRFTSKDIQIQTTLAAQVAVALQNARSFTRSEQALMRLQELMSYQTREGWDDYLARQAEKLSFSYASQQKTLEKEPADETAVPAEETNFVTKELQIHGESVGQLRLAPTQTYDEDVSEVVTAVIERLSVHLDNLRLAQQTQSALNETQRRTEELAVLNEMSQSLTAQTTVDGVFQTVYDYLSRLMDTTHFFTVTYDEESDEVAVVLTASGNELHWYTEQRQAGHGVVEYLIRQQQPLLIPDNVGERFAALGIKEDDNLPESWLGVPITLGDRVLGVLGLQSYTTPRLYNEEHLSLLTAVANQAAIAIESTRLLENTTALAEEEQILRQITTRVSTAVDAESILRTAAEEIGRALGLEGHVSLETVGSNGTNGHKSVANSLD